MKDTSILQSSKQTLVMGILNVTPDSFSDGGNFVDVERAVAHGIEMANAGAAIIDIGPESTRPGAKPVTIEEQIIRAIPVIEKLSPQTEALISIDTRNPYVASAAIEAGADIINDVTALADDKMAILAAEKQTPVILMHMLGDPATMQQSPKYQNVTDEVLEFLLSKAARAKSFGIEKHNIFLDPGIGFGKSIEHNLQLLRDMDRFVACGYKILLGTSRKKFIGMLTGKEKPDERVFGTAATVAIAVKAGVSIVRVHDVGEMVDVVKVASAMV